MNRDTKKWRSCARWPHKHGFDRDLTTDEHETRAAAQAVCDILQREGLGGDRVHFPFETWVEEIILPTMNLSTPSSHAQCSYAQIKSWADKHGFFGKSGKELRAAFEDARTMEAITEIAPL